MLKYNTFRIIRTAAIIIVIVLIIIFVSQSVCKKRSIKTSIVENQNTSSQNMEPKKTKFGDAELTMTENDKKIIEYQKIRPSIKEMDSKSESYKDVILTSNFKLEMRNDFKKGYTSWNRLKVDYDKDKNWDELWNVSKDGKIKREISTKDDGNYDYIYELKGEKWEKK